MSRPPLRIFRIVLTSLVVAIVGVMIFAAVLGWALVKPARHVMGPPPRELGATVVRIQSASGGILAGWYSPGLPGKGAVLLLHGVRADRWQMTGRALFLHRAGYGVLLIDFQAHGASTGTHITYGVRESDDAHAALQWLAVHNPHAPLAAIGVSMGAASALLGPTPLPVRALVLEEMYTTIDQGTANRMRNLFGPLGRVLTPLVLAQLQYRLAVPADSLRPIDRIAHIHAPVYIMAGSEDKTVSLAETHAVFARANDPKELWIVPGAEHIDLHAVARDEYEQKVLAFFARYLHS